jgi:hypothetical protein
VSQLSKTRNGELSKRGTVGAGLEVVEARLGVHSLPQSSRVFWIVLELAITPLNGSALYVPIGRQSIVERVHGSSHGTVAGESQVWRMTPRPL